MMNLILWLVFGALVGWLAGLVMNDREDTAQYHDRDYRRPDRRLLDWLQHDYPERV